MPQTFGFMIVGFRKRSMFVHNANLRNSDTIEVFETVEEADKKAYELEKDSKKWAEFMTAKTGKKKEPTEYLVIEIKGVPA